MTSGIIKRYSIFSLLLIILSGCAHYPINKPLLSNAKSSKDIVRKTPSGNDPGLLVILTLSGGGTRAAAFSYGVMQGLRDTNFEYNGRSGRLLDELDYIAALSGTGFVAAYYALNHDRFFVDFEKKFLKRNIEWGIVQYVFLNPVTLVRIMSPRFGRSDALAEYFDRILFHNATMKDLDANGPPEILINVTDITFGTRITLDREFFQLICSDYDSFPVTRALAASTAMIGLLTPITVHNYASQCNPCLRETIDNLQIDAQKNERAYQAMKQARSLLNSKDRPYLHFVDGGLADSLAIRSVASKFFIGRKFRADIGIPAPDLPPEVLFISVNAQEEPNSKWDKSKAGPGLTTIFYNSTKIILDSFNLETIELLKSLSREFSDEKGCMKIVEDSKICESLSLHVVEINFDGVKDPDLKKQIRWIPANYHLPSKDVDALIRAGREAINDSVVLNEFIKSSKKQKDNASLGNLNNGSKNRP
jgi:NTE family protein